MIGINLFLFGIDFPFDTIDLDTSRRTDFPSSRPSGNRMEDCSGFLVSDDGIIRTVHSGIGEEESPFAKKLGIICLNMRMCSDNGTGTSIDIFGKDPFLCCSLTVEVYDVDFLFFRGFIPFIEGIERIILSP